MLNARKHAAASIASRSYNTLLFNLLVKDRYSGSLINDMHFITALLNDSCSLRKNVKRETMRLHKKNIFTSIRVRGVYYFDQKLFSSCEKSR